MKYYFLLVFFLFAQNLRAQNFSLKVEEKKGLGNVKYQVIPFHIQDSVLLKNFIYDPKIGLNRFLYLITFTNGNSHPSYLRDSLFLLMNIDKSNNRKIQLDDDFDANFTNNTEHVFTPETKSYPIINIRRRQVIGNDTVVFYLPYELRAFDNRIAIGKIKKELTLTEAWYKEGKFNYQGQEYVIRLKEPLLTKDGKNDIFFRYKIANDTSEFSNPYRIGDTIRLDTKQYVLNLDQDNLRFTYVGQYDPTTYNFNRKDFISQKEIELSDFKGKYVLLDFWGSWCLPCIAGIPELKQFAKDYKDRIEIISIAFDRDEDTSKLKAIISEHEMDWTHIKEPRIFNNESGLNNKFDVKSFPTFILIDKNGNIIFNSSTSSTLKGLKQFLSKIDDL